MNLKTSALFSGAVLSTACLSFSTDAAVVVDFDGTGSYSGTHQAIGSIPGGFGVAFSDSTPQVAGASGTSSVYYGGMIHTAATGGAHNFQSPGGTAGSFSTGIHNRLNATNAGEAAVLAYWQSDDFLSSPGSPVSIDADTQFKLAFDNLGQRTVIVEWVIETSAGFFVSLSGSFVNPGGGGSFTDTDLLSNTWNSYDPATSLETQGAVAAPDLNDVIGVGYRLKMTGLNGASNYRTRVGEFEVFANPIPEPGSLLLAGAGGLLLLARRRRG